MTEGAITTKDFHFSVCPCETLGQVHKDNKLFSTVLYLEEKDLLKEDKTLPCVGTDASGSL